MEKIFKLFTVFLLAVSLTVATVICCCFVPAVMTHFHKISMCSHCHGQNSPDHSSNPAGTCQHHLTSAESSHSPAVLSFAASGVSFPVPVSFDKHITIFLPSSILACPRGSPPLTASFTPLYLRTFSLRI